MNEKIKYIITRESQGEITEKRSRFISYCSPAETKDEAEEYIKKIKTKHKDARHNVYAYVINSPYTAKYSDDGEPSGTSGPPILSLIQSMNIYNIVIVVTRYFGGILLGTGGLTRAYREVAKKSIESNIIIPLQTYIKYKLVCNYKNYEKIRLSLESLGAVFENIFFSESITADVKIPSNKSVYDIDSNLHPFLKQCE